MKISNKLFGLLLVVIMSPLFVKAQSATAPIVPGKAMFANQTVDLDRTDFYERMDREMLSLSFAHTNTLLAIKRANRYAFELVEILKAQKVPSDFLYLAAIESHFDNNAVSPAKAAGMWQFVPSTAREYGLEVTEYVDERYDFRKATMAACKYFKRAYAQYGSWLAVAASYNAGMGRITKSITTQNTENVLDLYLNNETSRYLFRLLAMKIVMENPRKYGFRLTADQLYQPIECEDVKITGTVENWVDWAQSRGITYSLLREMNPWIRKDSLPNPKGKVYIVKMPRSLYRSKQSLKTYNENWIK